ncbi:MAG: hypothetical protein ACYSUV_06205 [Planctomycetota bacterium]|jgi:hypothetical protein
MHVQKELSEKLIQLKDILSEMKALVEWWKLKAFENSRNPSARLFFSDDIQQQLSSKYGRFLLVSADIKRILQNKDCSCKKTQIIKELNKLYCQLHYLGTDVRVY